MAINKEARLQHHFPEEVIQTHILPRLPVKSLIRFKSVCKSWHSFISSNDFLKTHLEFSHSSPKFLIRDGEKFSSLSYNQNELKNLCNLHNEEKGPYKISGSCNGLICLVTHKDLVIWNPATQESRWILLPGLFISASGFGFSSHLDDYVVFVSVNRGLLSKHFLLTFKTGVWKKCYDGDGSRRQVGVFGYSYYMDAYVDDTMYWYISFCFSKRPHLVGFNVVNQQIVDVPPLDFVTQRQRVKVEVMEGYLCLICETLDRTIDVWLLKQQSHGGDYRSRFWEKFYSSSLPSIVEFPHYGLCNFGKWLVSIKPSGTLKLIDPNSVEEDLEHCRGVDGIRIQRCVHYIESLISPSIVVDWLEVLLSN